MRATSVLGTVLFLGLYGCGGGTGKRKSGVDASVAGFDGGMQTGTTIDSNGGTGGHDGSVDRVSLGGAAAEVGDRIDASEVGAVANLDAAVDRNGAGDACAALAVDAPPGELSVEEILKGADTLACVLLNVSGTVFADVREKPGSWPAPTRSIFILQDGGEPPGYMTGATGPYIQLWPETNLAPLLNQEVQVTGYLRILNFQGPNGESMVFPYLEIVNIAPREAVLRDAGPDAKGTSDALSCQPLAYSGGTSISSGLGNCPVDPSLPECKSKDVGAVVYRDEACAAATRKAHPGCDGWQRDVSTEVVILKDPFGGCLWPLSVDSVLDCGDHVSVAYSVIEPCATCDGIEPSFTTIIIANDPKPVRATATRKRPVVCP